MKKMAVLFASLLFLLVGCSQNASEVPKDGEFLYKKSCIQCHGENLQGASGPGVKNMAAKYSEAELLSLINEGVNMMPGKLLSEEEAETVTKWMMEQ